MDKPDLTGARVYVEAAHRPIAGGRWYVLPDGTTVVYETVTGAFQPAIIPAEKLARDEMWREVSDTASG